MNKPMPYYPLKPNAFTLVEMMVVVALIAILARISMPTYRQYVLRANRVAAEFFMMSVANKEVQLMLENHLYSAAAANNATAWSALMTIPSEVSANYSMSVAVDNTAAPPTYTITATPTGAQLSSDTKYGTLSLNQSGTKKKSGTDTLANCWR